MDLRSISLAVLSGLLLAFSFPSLDFAPLAWIGLAPLLIAIRDKKARTAAWLGGISGLVFFCGTIYWVTNSVHFYGGIPIVPASLITLLLCAYCALFPAAFGAAVARLRPGGPWIMLFGAPALWTALELIRTYLFSGFPWALLGYSQYRMLPLIQIADVTGVYGLSFLLVLVNVAVAQVVIDRKRLLIPAVATGLVILIAAYGRYSLAGAGLDNTAGVTIAVIQGNIEQDKKWDPAYQAEVTATYRRLSGEAGKQQPDLIIWPETATPFYFGGSGENGRQTRDLLQFAGALKTPLLFGSPTYEVLPGRKVVLRNSAFLAAPPGVVTAEYHKLHLVPFGEYVPLKSLLFFVDKMVQAIGDFGTGTEHTVMPLPLRRGGSVNISTVICYEIIFPDLVRRFVDRGARIMTTVTNDAWFGRTAAPYQHFAMAVFRAVENRVPVARAANTGVSGFIDASGRIMDTTPIFTEAMLTRTIVPGGKKTFYTRFGDLFAYACCVAACLLLYRPRWQKA